MRAFRPISGFAITLTAVAFALVGIAWWGQGNWREARLSRSRADLNYRELQRLAKTAPPPTEATATGIADELGRVEKVRAALQQEWQGREAGHGIGHEVPVPQDRTAAFFDLAALVERNRARARELGVAINADERFGFADYAHGAPPAELMLAVFRQRVVVDQLVRALLETKPERLIAVQRESPELNADELSGARSDYMVMPAGRSLRSAGLIKATGFRLKFSGYTSTLRAFLNRLAALELPIVVRAVEAEPPLNAKEGDKALPAPLVARSLTEFTVTMEYLETGGETPPQL